ncbi:unnamed protein product [Soboliphyme baturini]|uniref:WH1 domain-containing protein n=1 Tax=Soboliphyme baturini TaxID=241478 RepID=A0A183IIK0_9BILA|nr:unnamed protein product [Soboliphyme baturini]
MFSFCPRVYDEILNISLFFVFSEQAVINVHASVLVYDDAAKKWVPSGSSKQHGVSLVQILKNVQLSTFRVVGRKLQDHEVVINSLIGKSFKYSLSPSTFLQWRDQNVVYGLNFLNAEDASAFGTAMLSAVESMSATYGQVHAQNGFSTVSSAPNFRQLSGNNVTHLEVQDDNGDACRPVAQLQRRASQSSNASSGSTGSSVPNQSNVIYSSNIGPSSVCTGQQFAGATPSRAAPPAPPPAPPLQLQTASRSLGGGFGRGTGGSSSGSNPPAPPPLPPSDCGSSTSWQNSRPTNFAQALASAKLRKTCANEESKESKTAEISASGGHRFGALGSNSSIGGISAHSDIISEITATLAKRRMLQENATEPEVPSGSSLSSQEETLSSLPSLRSLSNGSTSASHLAVSPERNHPCRELAVASRHYLAKLAVRYVLWACKHFQCLRLLSTGPYAAVTVYKGSMAIKRDNEERVDDRKVLNDFLPRLKCLAPPTIVRCVFIFGTVVARFYAFLSSSRCRFV